MALPASLLKRLEALECKIDPEGKNALKVFIFHPEAERPFWSPEPPEAWQQSHPKGKAVILQRRDMSGRFNGDSFRY